MFRNDKMRHLNPYLSIFTYLIVFIWSLIWSVIYNLFKTIDSIEKTMITLGFGERLKDMEDIFHSRIDVKNN